MSVDGMTAGSKPTRVDLAADEMGVTSLEGDDHANMRNQRNARFRTSGPRSTTSSKAPRS